MREQSLDMQVDDFAGNTGHFAISLARGLDGRPRDFRGVYDVLYAMYYMNALGSGKTAAEAEAYAQKLAWNLSVRTFRGTQCDESGECFTKDIVYREGNIGVWDVIRTSPADMMHFDVGKYDPTNPRHVWILSRLGITDEDLGELERKV